MATPVTATHDGEEEKTASTSSPTGMTDTCHGLLIMAAGLIGDSTRSSTKGTSTECRSCSAPASSKQTLPPPHPKALVASLPEASHAKSYYDHSPWDLFYVDATPTWGLPPLTPLGRVSSTILEHPAQNIGPYHVSGVTFVMFDVRGYASEYVPVFVTAVHQRDPQRKADTSHAADIQYGEGVLMANLLSASVCGHRTVGLHCRFHYDGTTYLVADEPMDFVWVPSDGFRRSRPPFIGDACPELEGKGYRTAYEYFSRRFSEYVDEYFKEEEEETEGKHQCKKQKQEPLEAPSPLFSPPSSAEAKHLDQEESLSSCCESRP